MQVKLSKKGSTLIVGIIGELDHHTAEYVRQKIDSELIKSTTRNVVIDLSKLSFMDSSGIGVIMGRYKNVQQLNGKMAITVIGSQIRRILEMAGLNRIIPVYDSMDSAVNSFM